MPQISNQQMQFVNNLLRNKGMSAEQLVRQTLQAQGKDVDAWMRDNGLMR